MNVFGDGGGASLLANVGRNRADGFHSILSISCLQAPIIPLPPT